MHRRLIDLASSSEATFSFACPNEDVDDAVTLADAHGWSLAETQTHRRP